MDSEIQKLTHAGFMAHYGAVPEIIERVGELCVAVADGDTTHALEDLYNSVTDILTEAGAIAGAAANITQKLKKQRDMLAAELVAIECELESPLWSNHPQVMRVVDEIKRLINNDIDGTEKEQQAYNDGYSDGFRAGLRTAESGE